MDNDKSSLTLSDQKVPGDVIGLQNRIAHLEEIVNTLEVEKRNGEALFRYFRESMLICDSDLRLIRANRSFLSLFEVTLQNILGRPVQEVLFQRMDPSFEFSGVLEAVSAGKSFSSGPFNFPSRGNSLDLCLDAFPFELSNGEKGVCLIIHDLTAFARKEGLLRSRLELQGLVSRVSASLAGPSGSLEPLYSTLKELTLFLGLDGIKLFVPTQDNKDLELILDLSGKEGGFSGVKDLPTLLDDLGPAGYIYFDPTSSDEPGNKFLPTVDLSLPVPCFILRLDHEGQFQGILALWGEGLLENSDEEVLGTLAFLGQSFGAALSRKRAEETRERIQQRYHQIVDDQLDLVNTYDSEGRITYANRAFCNYYGIDREDVQSVNLMDLTPEDERDDLREKILSISPDFPILVNEAHMDLPSGGTIWQQWMNKGVFDREGTLVEVIGVGRDITRIKRMEEELKRTIDTLQGTFEATINAMGKIIEVKDPYTAGHQQNVADLTHAIAQEMDLSQESIDAVYYASLVHDIGKIQIPSEILNKPGRLNDMEYSLVKNHPFYGYEILNTVNFPWPVARIVLQHHERMNGMGYPNGLEGDEILMEARIMAVADVVEAMSAHRPYRTSLGLDCALDEISRYSGTLYDRQIVETCLSLFRERGFTFRVNNGRDNLSSMR